MHAFARFGALVGISILSLISIALLLPSRYSTKLQDLGKDYLPTNYLGWTGSDGRSGLTVVVFGDSWADDGSILGTGRLGSVGRDAAQGKVWTEVLCEEVSFHEIHSPVPFLTN
jgi:hypothetical protein